MQVICGTPTLKFDPNAKSSKLSGGGIAGVVVGVVLGVAIVALIVGFFGYRRYQEHKVSLLMHAIGPWSLTLTIVTPADNLLNSYVHFKLGIPSQCDPALTTSFEADCPNLIGN